jgi:hypothetical protein
MTKKKIVEKVQPWIAAVMMPSGHVMKLPFDTKELAQAYIEHLRELNPTRKFTAEVVEAAR